MMRKKVAAIFMSLFIVLQVPCLYSNELVMSNEKEQQLKEQIALVLKKYEGLGLSQEQLAQKVIADLVEQAKVCQGDVAENEEANDKNGLRKKLLIGGVIVGCSLLAYFIYVKFFKRKPRKPYNPLQNVKGVVSGWDKGRCHCAGYDENNECVYDFYARRGKNGSFELDPSEKAIGTPDAIEAMLKNLS